MPSFMNRWIGQRTQTPSTRNSSRSPKGLNTINSAVSDCKEIP